jgi:hypothetical protein
MWRRAFDKKVLVVNLIDLAVKKELAILEDLSGGYILGRLQPGSQPISAPRGLLEGPLAEITADEKLVVKTLFAAGDTIRLEPTHCSPVGGSLEALHHRLRSNLEKVDFVNSGRYLVPGLLISLGTVVRCGFAVQGAQRTLVLILAMGLLPGSLGCLTLGRLALAACKNALSDPLHAPTARKLAMVMSGVCLAFFIAEVVGLGILAWAASTEVVAVLLLMVAINYLAYFLLKSSTRAGRALAEQIEGFRMFLTTMGQDARTPLKGPPDWFERFLPYAMALNVEKVWGEKFAAAWAQTTRRGKTQYSPRWYSGPGWNPITASTFATELGNSFSSAIASATSAPGTSSGGNGR